jgi:DNA-binding CsgD family transcriptional regulator
MAKYEIDVGHLDYCKTQQQKEVVSRRVAGASLKQIADDMGLQKSNVGRALKDIYNAAAISALQMQGDEE